ncbi:uncharacterized protein LOC114521282 isoform X3 [Dendronephthya gigantea]|uniref:uncharacterized protein LOC114521282 isoform X3 n=1 Tax=Dendronephthya gigantea TaxID=151771 RepID=UPI00106D0848|nr:uncharacterized protein LOC114521282 isoform X3 [Dendronephthya gigantea]
MILWKFMISDGVTSNSIHRYCTNWSLKICGVCFVSQSKPILDSSSISEIFSGADMKSDLIDNTQILWVLDPVSKEEEDDSVFVYNLLSKSVEESKVYFNNINDEFISKHMTLRLHHKFDILVEKSSDVDISSGLCKKITQFCNKLHDAIFYLPECRLLIGGEMTQSSGKKCQDILDDIIMNEEASKAKYNQRLKTQLKDVLNVRLVKSLSKDDTLKCHNHAPVMLYQKRKSLYHILIMVLIYPLYSQVTDNKHYYLVKSPNIDFALN